MDPAPPYTIHHKSGLDNDGQWGLLAVLSSESDLYSFLHLFFKFTNPGQSRSLDPSERFARMVGFSSGSASNGLHTICASYTKGWLRNHQWPLEAGSEHQ